MDEYDPRRLPGFREGKLELSTEDLVAFAAAHPEMSQQELQSLRSAGSNDVRAEDEAMSDAATAEPA